MIHNRCLEFVDYLAFDPQAVLEAGVGLLERCRSRPYWRTAHCVLFEPVQKFYESLSEAARDFPRVQVFPHALWDHADGVEFHDLNMGISYVNGVTPRTRLGDRQKRQALRRVPSMILGDVDKGQFDLVLLDMECAEWHAIKHMLSRPKLLVVELYKRNQAYRHPHDAEIRHWCKQNGYREVGRIVSDAVFARGRY